MPNVYDPPAFALRLAHKDVTLATALGRELGVPMRISNLTLEEMTEAMNRGWAGRDSRVAMLLQEERAGVEIKVPQERLQQTVDALAESESRIRAVVRGWAGKTTGSMADSSPNALSVRMSRSGSSTSFGR